MLDMHFCYKKNSKRKTWSIIHLKLTLPCIWMHWWWLVMNWDHLTMLIRREDFIWLLGLVLDFWDGFSYPQEVPRIIESKGWLWPPAPPAPAALVLEWPVCAAVRGQQGGHFFIFSFICSWCLFPMTRQTSVCLIQMLSNRRSALELAFASIWRMNYRKSEWCWHLKIF